VRRFVTYSGLAVLVFSGCPARAVRLDDVTTRTDDPVAEADFRAAQQSFREGDRADARVRFEAFARDHARDPLVPAAQLYLARLDVADGHPADARAKLAPLVLSDDDALAEQARFVDGIALAAMGPEAAERALATLEPFAGRLVDRADAVLLYRTLVDLLERTQRPGDALRYVDGLLRVVDDGERADVRTRMRRLVDACTTAQADAAYAALPRDGEAWAVLALRRARLAVDSGNSTQARAIVEDLVSAFGEDDLRVAEARELLLDREVVDEHTIGAILPLSGHGRELGAQALRGLLLAAGTLDASAPGTGGFRLAVRDDGGDPERASRAVADLVETDHVVAIVGPLESATAESAARAAEAVRVPLLVLSPREGLTQIGPNVFRAFWTAQIEAKALARHVVSGLGLRRIAILHVEAPYATSMKATFSAAVTDLGGSVVATQSYAAGTTTFGPVIAPLAAVPFDAILVVDAARTVGLVAPALAAAGLWSRPAGAGPPAGGRAVQLLLPSLAFDAALPRQAARYLEGAVCATGFFPGDPAPATAAFVAAYRERFESDPGYVAAFAHDAFLRARTVVESGARSRTSFRESLSSMRPPPGASALGAFGEAREPVEAVRLLRVESGAFVPLSPR